MNDPRLNGVSSLGQLVAQTLVLRGRLLRTPVGGLRCPLRGGQPLLPVAKLSRVASVRGRQVGLQALPSRSLGSERILRAPLAFRCVGSVTFLLL